MEPSRISKRRSTMARFLDLVRNNLLAAEFAAAGILLALYSYSVFSESTQPPPSTDFSGSIEIGTGEGVEVKTYLAVHARFELDDDGGSHESNVPWDIDPGRDVELRINFRGRPSSEIPYLLLMTDDARLTRRAGPYEVLPSGDHAPLASPVTVMTLPNDSRWSSSGDDGSIWEYLPTGAVTAISGTVRANRQGQANLVVSGKLSVSLIDGAAARTAVEIPGVSPIAARHLTVNAWPPITVSPKATITLAEQTGVSRPWYRPKSLQTSISVGHIEPTWNVLSSSPPLVDPATLAWTGNLSRVTYVIEDQIEKANLDRRNFFAGAVAGVSGALIVEAIKATSGESTPSEASRRQPTFEQRMRQRRRALQVKRRVGLRSRPKPVANEERASFVSRWREALRRLLR